MTGLNDLIKHDAENVFSNKHQFAEPVVFYPKGVRKNRVPLDCVVDQANEIGSRESHGDGIVLNREEGYSVRTSIVVELPTTLTVADPQDQVRPDTIKVNNRMYVLKRSTGRDAGFESWLCVRLDRKETKDRRRGG